MPKSKMQSGVPVLPVSSGLNRFIWDLRLNPPTGVPGAVYQEGSRLQGVLVVPGEYTVKLDVDGETQTVPLRVELNPGVKTSSADLQQQFDLATKISDRISETHETVNSMRELRKQIEALEDRNLAVQDREQILSAAKAVDQTALAVETALFQVQKTAEKDSFNYGGRLNDMFIGLEAAVERADTAPTQQMYDVYDYLDQQLQAQLKLRTEIMNTQIPALNKLLHSGDVPFIYVMQSGTQH